MAAAVEPAAARVQRKTAQTDNTSAAVCLHFENKRRQKPTEVKISRQTTPLGSSGRSEEVHVQTAEVKKPEPHRGYRGGRTAPSQLRSSLVTGTPTPMGQLLVGWLGDLRRKKSGHKTQPCAADPSVPWLAGFGKGGQYVEYLEARRSEPRNRGAHKNANFAFVFLNEVAGAPLAERHTASQLYTVINRDLLARALLAGSRSRLLGCSRRCFVDSKVLSLILPGCCTSPWDASEVTFQPWRIASVSHEDDDAWALFQPGLFTTGGSQASVTLGRWQSLFQLRLFTEFQRFFSPR